MGRAFRSQTVGPWGILEMPYSLAMNTSKHDARAEVQHRAAVEIHRTTTGGQHRQGEIEGEQPCFVGCGDSESEHRGVY